MPEFEAFPKIPRLNREVVVTEKLDGTNAAIVVELLGVGDQFDPDAHNFSGEPLERRPLTVANVGDSWYGIWAQSRKRFVVPGNDNYGFAAWVYDNAVELVHGLGEGRHFGEWWGQGIQRGYGLDEKRFSLFNAGRWYDANGNGAPDGGELVPKCCHVVPVLTLGTNIQAAAEGGIAMLEDNGSHAAPGYDNPEGVVVYHTAARLQFKVTIENDESPKAKFAEQTGAAV